MSHNFKIGDRVHCFHSDLIDAVRGRLGTVTRAEPYGVYALIDDTQNPTSDGWSFNPAHLELVEAFVEPTDEEIAAVFGIEATQLRSFTQEKERS